MKNIINYYYDLNPIDVYMIENKIYFNYKNYDYYFLLFDRSINEIQSIYNLFCELKMNNVQTNSIVLNREKKIITFVNNIPYIMIRNDMKNKRINLNDILYIQNNTMFINQDKKIVRDNWGVMWQKKIDYYEEQKNNIFSKYKLIDYSIDYYIGLGENAISFYINNDIKNKKCCLSHNRIDVNKNSFYFYNPTNYILDSRVRDIAEYIKSSFFLYRIDIDLIKKILELLNFNKEEYMMLFSRLLFPTYYFDVIDMIAINNMKDNMVENIIKLTDKYICLLKGIFLFVIYQKGINIPYIEWIIKKTD